MEATLYKSNISGLRRIHCGKVRDIYEVDERRMLIVTTDRISAFDVILPTPIPGKGEVLTSISNFWFGRTAAIIGNHLTDIALNTVIDDPPLSDALAARSVIVERLQALPLEAIVRGYLIGSGWKDYQRSGEVCGIRLPAGLQFADKLPEAIFTPSTKADTGDHDINIGFEDAAERVGRDIAERVRTISLRLYTEAADYALRRGIIIADTKFEFALDKDGQLVLIDEVLTPDSSRFWPAAHYRAGISPPSFDKQFVRDYLETLDWDKTPPGPALPETIVKKTAEKYQQAKKLLVE